MLDSTLLRALAETRGYQLGQPVRYQITADESAVLFLRGGPRDPVHALWELDVASGRERELASAAALLGGAVERISVEEQARRERQRVTDRGLTSFALSPDGGLVLVPLSGRLWLIERPGGAVRELTRPDESPVLDARLSPDGKRVAFVRDFDLWVAKVAPGSGPPRRLTEGGRKRHGFGLAELVAQEEMGRFEGYWWSPAGDRIACAEVDESEVEHLSIADFAHPEAAPPSFAYPRAGKPNARVGLLIVAAGRDPRPAAVPVRWDGERHPYLARVLWPARPAPLSILVQSRDQREVAFLAVDEATGGTRPLLVERDADWVNLGRDVPRWLPDGSGFLWASEASGSRTLELHRPDGSLERVVPAGTGTFLNLAHVDPRGQTACVLAGDALSSRIWRVGLRGPESSLLADDGADHVPVFSRRGRVMVDLCTRADAWPRVLVRGADGRILRALPSAAEEPALQVDLELLTVGERELRAAVVRPRDFRPDRRYPVIVHVYGGPHALVVKADRRAYLHDQALADQGAIVVCVDGLGTPRRDRAWERALKGRLTEIPLESQVEGLQALGNRLPELDLGRVGIFGWSFGGTLAALAVMRRPDLFHVAVAGAPVADWRDYDTHYTERYLDLPAACPEAYEGSSLLRHASGLARPLLIVHGTADDNVYFCHSLKLIDALVRAGRSFHFLPLPGVSHQMADARVREEVWRRTGEFLFAHLGPQSSSHGPAAPHRRVRRP